MKICKWFIRDYLDLVTVCWFDHNELPPEDLGEYDPLIQQLEIAARTRNQLNLLRTCLCGVLANPTLDASDLGGGRYQFDDQEIRQIMAHVLSRLWPDAPCQPEAVIELYELPYSAWERLKQSGSIVG